MKKRWMTAFLAAAVLVTSAVGCGKLNKDDIVAEAKDVQITAGVANFYARYQQAMTETYYAYAMGEKMWAGEAEEGVTYEKQVKDGVMKALQTLYVLDTHKEEYNVALTEEDEAAIDSAVKAFTEANKEEAKEIVSGDTESVKKVLELLTIRNKMQEAMTADVDTAVTDEEAAQKSMQYVYFLNVREDEDGTAVPLTEKEKANMKKEAEEFRKGAVSAKDFKAYAEEKGYEVVTLTFDSEKTTPVKAMIEAADALKEGEVTEVIEDVSGLYVAKVTSLLDREATDKKKEQIVEQRKADVYNKLCEDWIKDAGFKVNKKVWDKISFVKQGVTLKKAADDK